MVGFLAGKTATVVPHPAPPLLLPQSSICKIYGSQLSWLPYLLWQPCSYTALHCTPGFHLYWVLFGVQIVLGLIWNKWCCLYKRPMLWRISFKQKMTIIFDCQIPTNSKWWTWNAPIAMTKLSSLGLLIAVQKLLELTRFEKLLLHKYSVTLI